MSASFYLRHGNLYPYDADGDGAFRSAEDDWSLRAARGVLANLCDRRGIKQELEQVDRETRAEMVRDLADIISLAAREERLSSTDPS